MGTEALEEA